MSEEPIDPPTSPRHRGTNERTRLLSSASYVEHQADPTSPRSQRVNERHERQEEHDSSRTEAMDTSSSSNDVVMEEATEAPGEAAEDNIDQDNSSRTRRTLAGTSTSRGPQPKKGRRSKRTPAELNQQPAEEEPMEVVAGHEITREESRMLKTGIVARLDIFPDESKRSSKAAQEETIQMLKKCYETVKKEYDELAEEELSTDYLLAIGNDGENVFRQHALAKNYQLPTLKFENLKIDAADSTKLSEIKPEVSETGDTQSRVQVPSFPIAVGDIRPRMHYWIPIEQSITTDDQKRLTHIPYFEDGQNDTEIHLQMCDVFPEGIHGMGDNWNYINDWILYKLMRNVLEQGLTVAPDLFYYGIYSIWPNKWTQTRLSTDFPILCDTFAEENFNPRDLESWKRDPDQIVASNLQGNQVECYACLSYMCPTHGFSKAIPAEFPGGEFLRVEVPLPNSLDTDYCSDDCWKMCEFEDAVEMMNPTDEEKQNRTVIAYINKTGAAKMETEEGLLAATYGVSSSMPFCEFSSIFVDSDDDTQRIRTCRAAYEFISKTVERVSAARLECSRPSKKFDFQKRTRAFRTHHYNKAKEEAKAERLENAQLEGEENAKRKKDTVTLELTVPLVGCRHSGPCGADKDTCVCTENGVCSYLCQCDVNCKIRFPGCNCANGQCQTKACQCFRVRWECHPQTCKACKCAEPNSEGGSCSNHSLMKLASKRLLVAPSKISGHGLFILETAEKDEFITEYVGERITDDEAERRGSIYDRYQTSYIFNLDTGGAIDSYRLGNLARFANHDSKNPTCYARTVVVGGESRIAFWARHKLEPNTELTFDYSYSGEHQKVFKKSTPRKKKGRPSRAAE